MAAPSPASKPASPNAVTASVLWRKDPDGSVHIERVYLNETRAAEDHGLIASLPGGSAYKLDKAPMIGVSKPGPRNGQQTQTPAPPKA